MIFPPVFLYRLRIPRRRRSVKRLGEELRNPGIVTKDALQNFFSDESDSLNDLEHKEEVEAVEKEVEGIKNFHAIVRFCGLLRSLRPAAQADELSVLTRQIENFGAKWEAKGKNAVCLPVGGDSDFGRIVLRAGILEKLLSILELSEDDFRSEFDSCAREFSEIKEKLRILHEDVSTFVISLCRKYLAQPDQWPDIEHLTPVRGPLDNLCTISCVFFRIDPESPPFLPSQSLTDEWNGLRQVLDWGGIEGEEEASERVGLLHWMAVPFLLRMNRLVKALPE
ncbi:MAG: hypothetical protein NTZ35_01465 [Ignavibacteriales bacterium]|nr:hypothetical protein [Ignavibacteriales bacterium]